MAGTTSSVPTGAGSATFGNFSLLPEITFFSIRHGYDLLLKEFKNRFNSNYNRQYLYPVHILDAVVIFSSLENCEANVLSKIKKFQKLKCFSKNSFYFISKISFALKL